MKVKVYVIDFELPPRAKRWALRLGVPALVVAGASAMAFASVPVTWHPGDTLTADSLNQSFAGLDQRLTALEAFREQATADGGYSVGATYCGATPISYTGTQVGGYANARVLCQQLAACGSSPGAHVCTSDEMVRSLQLGKKAPSGGGWYAAGVLGYVGNSLILNDCGGFGASTSFNGGLGANWQDGTAPWDDTCGAVHPIFCCN